jgi:hypothetical protein
MSDPKGFPVHRLLKLLQCRVDLTNLSLSSEHSRATDEALIAWIEDVEERLCGFEAALANIGPAVHDSYSHSYEDGR